MKLILYNFQTQFVGEKDYILYKLLSQPGYYSPKLNLKNSFDFPFHILLEKQCLWQNDVSDRLKKDKSDKIIFDSK